MHGMSTLTFDTLDATRRLRDAGFDEKQAETVVRVLSDAQDRLITKDDLKLEMIALRAEMHELELRLTIKLGAFLSIAVGILIAVLRVAH